MDKNSEVTPSTFLRINGAGQQVTGSCFAIEIVDNTGRKILFLDCGGFQDKGGPIELSDRSSIAKITNGEESNKNWIIRKNFLELPLAVGPDELPISEVCIVVTHAHFDHCARLVVLVKVLRTLYPNVKISLVATPETAELLPVALHDTRGIQDKFIRKNRPAINKLLGEVVIPVLEDRNNGRNGRKNKIRRQSNHHKHNAVKVSNHIKPPYTFTGKETDAVFSNAKKEESSLIAFPQLMNIREACINMTSYIDIEDSVKKIRYLLKLLSDVYGKARSVVASEMRQLQSSLEGSLKNIEFQQRVGNKPINVYIPYDQISALITAIDNSKNNDSAGGHSDESETLNLAIDIITPDFREIVQVIESTRTSIQLLQAGHIVGSAQVVVRTEVGGQKRTILYTGDIGSHKSETRIKLVGEPDTFFDAYREQGGSRREHDKDYKLDLMITESTYGGEKRKRQQEDIRKMEKHITETIKSGGNVVVPSFALERTQDFLFKIYDLVQKLNAELVEKNANDKKKLYKSITESNFKDFIKYYNLLISIAKEKEQEEIRRQKNKKRNDKNLEHNGKNNKRNHKQEKYDRITEEWEQLQKKKRKDHEREAELLAQKLEILELTHGRKNIIERMINSFQCQKVIGECQRAIEENQKTIEESFLVWKKSVEDMEIHPVKVIMDSPLAIKFTKIFSTALWRKHINRLRKEKVISSKQEEQRFNETFQILNYEGFEMMPVPNKGGDEFRHMRTKTVIKHKDSHFDKIHNIERPCIIVSSSGMGDHGAAREHIKRALNDELSTIILPGYMAEGTLGRKIMNIIQRSDIHHPTIEIDDEVITIRATVIQLTAFSSHADKNDLLSHVSRNQPDQLMIVHGERGRMKKLAQSVQMEIGKFKGKGVLDQDDPNWAHPQIHMPITGDSYDLSELFSRVNSND